MFSLERAGRWFLASGIQEASGGVARYYRIDRGANAPVSTEITGYACEAFLYLAGRTGQAEYRTAALRAGRFLTGCAWDARIGALPFEWPANGAALAYFFDCGIVSRALHALWREEPEPEFIDTARACAASMARDFRDGSCWHAVIDLPGKRPLPAEPRWSRQPGCYQLKAALAWLQAGDYAHYEAQRALALAGDASFLPGADEPGRVVDRLHAYLYYLEGLLPSLGDAECRNALASGIVRAAVAARQHRGVYERSDVYAQLLRIRLYADRLGVLPLDMAAAAEEAAAIPEFQMSSWDPRIDGCVAFGRAAGTLLPYANPVSTAFAIQACEMWSDYQAGRFQPDWRELI